MMTRRGGLRLAAGAAAATALRPRLSSAGMPRLAAIDWAALETALAMGASPVAAAELRQYAEICVEPTLPEGIIDIGLRGPRPGTSLRSRNRAVRRNCLQTREVYTASLTRQASC